MTKQHAFVENFGAGIGEFVWYDNSYVFKANCLATLYALPYLVLFSFSGILVSSNAGTVREQII